MKQAVSWALSLVFAGGSALSALAVGAGYGDVPAAAWYAGAVHYVTEKGLMSGTGAGKFSPGTPMTRAMLTAVLYRSEGRPRAHVIEVLTEQVNPKYLTYLRQFDISYIFAGKTSWVAPCCSTS